MLDIQKHAMLYKPKDREIPIIVIGLGAIGSRIAMGLAKLGLVNLHLYDDDIVEQHNLANQLYGKQDIEIPKVWSMCQLINDDIGIVVHSYQNKVDSKTSLTAFPIVFVCVDTMAARKEIYENVKRRYACELLVEGRITARSGAAYAIDPREMQQTLLYEEMLYPDEDVKAEFGGCNITPSIGATADLVAGIMLHLFIQHSNQEDDAPNEVLFNTRPWEMRSCKW